MYWNYYWYLLIFKSSLRSLKSCLSHSYCIQYFSLYVQNLMWYNLDRKSIVYAPLLWPTFFLWIVSAPPAQLSMIPWIVPTPVRWLAYLMNLWFSLRGENAHIKIYSCALNIKSQLAHFWTPRYKIWIRLLYRYMTWCTAGFCGSADSS